MPTPPQPRPLPRTRMRPGRAAAARGFTLIEMLVVLAIVVMIIGLALSSIGDTGTTKLRVQSNRLAAALRHTYSRSVAHGLYMRMVFDLDANAYWVEASDQPIFLPAVKRNEGDDPDAPTKEEEEQAKIDERRSKNDTPHFRLPRAKFQTDGVIPKVTLERGVELHGVLTSGQEEEFFNGKAYVHFFPNGWVEPAIIHISDGEEAFFTLVVDPLTGKVTRLPGKAQANQQFGVPDKVESER